MRKDMTLQLLGFTPAAQQVYLLLLKHNTYSIADISRLTGKHRPAIYKAIAELAQARLVSRSLHGKRIVYKAESPVALSTILQSQTQDIIHNIHEYKTIYDNKDCTPKVTIFEGKSGIATAYEELLKNLDKREKIYRYESPRDYKANKKYYPALYWKRAGAMGDIDKYVITNQKTNIIRRNSLNRFSKSITNVNSLLEYNVTQLISKNTVLFIDYDTETAIMISNQRLAEYQTYLFQLLFEKL